MDAESLSREKIDWVSLIARFWEKQITIVCVLIVTAVVLIRFFSGANLLEMSTGIDWFEWSILSLLLMGIFLFWHFSRKPPITSKGKIGIVVGISCEDKKERQRLKADFVMALKSEITKGNSQHFEVLELSEYHAKKITSQESARKYHKAMRAHLIIYGNARVRGHHGTEHYVIDLNASILHISIPQEVSNAVSREMRALIPQQRLFPVSDEVTGFSITRKSMGLATRYIVGVASLLSGDISTSFDLHLGLWDEIKKCLQDEQDFKDEYGYLKTKLPNRLAVEGVILANFVYRSKEENYLRKMERFLSVLQEVDPGNYEAHLLRGIYYFLFERDIVKAKEEIRKSRNERDVSWQFSDAFLTAYDGDLETAHKIYRRAFLGNVSNAAPLEVETFIQDVLEQEPSKIQLWYCLGMINYFSKGDLQLAKQDFEKFIEEARKANSFLKSIDYAATYIAEIEKN
ncbi:MAG: hypothetical protein WC530_02165 [Candidatus Omnitrophota bacterium]|jgi:tetratricopeptide (TPR) repeat protein